MMTCTARSTQVPGIVLVLIVSVAMSVVGNGNSETPTSSQENPTSPPAAAYEATATPPIPTSQLPAEFRDQSPPGAAGREFTTDFGRATISYRDVVSGGPPKDGIPSIDDPSFVDVDTATEWIGPREPVLLLTITADGKREHRVYPLQILTWHEIVNDTVNGVPVTVTYCPLCNTGVAFQRAVEGRVLDFGTTGRLRYSNLIMYDRQTESWWQQASGRGVAGFYAGARLAIVPIRIVAFEVVRERFSEALVLSRDTGYSRSYGRNPYVGYDQLEEPFLYRGPAVDSRYDPLERVVSIEHDGDVAAVAYRVLEERGSVPLTVGGTEFVVVWRGGTASALDTASIAEGRDVGSANAFFARTEDGEPVQFESDRSSRAIFESADGTTWDETGRAVSGPRRGAQLQPAAGIQHFWFSHAALVASNSREATQEAD